MARAPSGGQDRSSVFGRTNVRATARLGVIAALATVWLAPAPAQAQNDDAKDGDRTGLRIEGFILRPTLSQEVEYNTNYLGEADAVATFIARSGAGLALETDWTRHRIEASVSTEAGFVEETNNDNYLDVDASIAGEIDVRRDFRIRIDFDYAKSHESRGDDDSPDAVANVIELETYTINIDFRYKPNRFRLQPFLSASLTDYHDVSLLTGVTADQDGRDVIDYTAGVEVGYEFLRGYEAFLRFSASQSDNIDEFDGGGFNRDNTSYTISGGVNFDITRLIEGRVGVGWSEKFFEDNDPGRFEDFEGFSLDVGVNWSVTPLTTVTFDAARRQSATTLVGSSTKDRLTGRLGVEHSLRRNITADAFVEVSNETFEGLDREDREYTAGIGFSYDVNSYATVDADYVYELVDPVGAEDYKVQRGIVGLKLKF